jgi:hypothetical protein
MQLSKATQNSSHFALGNDISSPDLRIVGIQSLYPHERHDSQRAYPLIERLKDETSIINPPIVASIGDENYVVLDGANRYYAFSHLGYQHILVQVVSYHSTVVELHTWRHVISNWDIDQLLHLLRQIPEIRLVDGHTDHDIAHILLKNRSTISIAAPQATFYEANAALHRVVQVYQQNAILHRTAVSSSEEIWESYPDGIAVIDFPQYHLEDIIRAAKQKAYLPPGITRHVIHGRALRVNFPLDFLRNSTLSLEEKNQQLKQWLQAKYANRQVRYYEEATYQFDE